MFKFNSYIKHKSEINRLLSLSDNDFVAGLYLAMLARSADISGYRHFIGLLEAGGKRQAITKAIGDSVEFHENNNLLAKELRDAFSIYWQLSKLGIVSEIKPSGDSLNAFKLRDAQACQHPTLDIFRGNSYDNRSSPEGGNCIWMDLTTVLEWTGGVIGIVRAELEVARNLYSIDNGLKFCCQVDNGFVEIKKEQLGWLLNSKNVTNAYLGQFGRLDQGINEKLKVFIPLESELFHPFMISDVFLSVGWMDSNKEATLSKIKAVLPDFYICYQVYDTILLNKNTSFFYAPENGFKFNNYLKWISHNADLVFYGGRSTMKDAQQVQKTNSWPVPDAIPLKFGTDISKSEHTQNEETEILGRLGLNSRFIMIVGTIEPRKNHLTVFRAYQLLIKEGVDVPVLVVCGNPSGMVNDMLNQTKNDPNLKNRILFLSPTDEELAVLYKHCLFTVLPTLSEGWSLTLPESLSYGKYCLCSDIPPLREIANDLVDFVEPYNVRMWANSIKKTCDDLPGLNQKQEKIAKYWEKTTWKDTAGAISNGIAAHTSKTKARAANPEIWFDLTTSFLHANGNMSGIVRVELSYAKAIYEMYANVHFFAYWDGDLFEINIGMLSWLFDSLDIESSFKCFDTYWRNRESSGTGHRVPYADDADVTNRDKYVLRRIGNQSLVLLVNIDWDLAWTPCIVKLARQSNSTVAQFIHDVTPIIVPHLHRKKTCDAFMPFFEFCSNEMNFLHYGGKVAQSDGIAVQKAMGWKSPPSKAMKLASDFILQNDNPALEESLIRGLGINGDFIITVGTLEPRKNHEVLYKAYLNLLESGNHSEVPMMIFLGKPGWNSDDFLTILKADKRVADKIKILSPNDQQLDALYKKCLFAVLPSFYEGYSLTLNEVLGRGKFCIASDTPPLREVGAEFAEYVDPLDCNKWAERILHHSKNKSLLNVMEAKIAQNWQHITWVDSARELVSSAQAEMRRMKSNGAVKDG